MFNYEKFSTAPIKVRVLYVKKLLNNLGYNLEENFIEDKKYKTALKKFQADNNFGTNCIISKEVFYCLISQVKDYQLIWKNLK